MTTLLTARNVADTLGVSAETILRWTRKGDLPAVRLPGGSLRYRSSELEQWLREHTTSSCDPMPHEGPTSLG